MMTWGSGLRYGRIFGWHMDFNTLPRGRYIAFMVIPMDVIANRHEPFFLLQPKNTMDF
jgi:hypothetical protein